jgi:hypothetical protein
VTESAVAGSRAGDRCPVSAGSWASGPHVGLIVGGIAVLLATDRTTAPD